mgnify:CR=1 FL=1
MATEQNMIGPTLRHLREAEGLTQAEFAARLQLAGWDISRETLAKVESQFRCVTDRELGSEPMIDPVMQAAEFRALLDLARRIYLPEVVAAVKGRVPVMIDSSMPRRSHIRCDSASAAGSKRN